MLLFSFFIWRFFFEFPFISYNIPKRLSNHIKVRLEVLLHKPGGKHGPENKKKVKAVTSDGITGSNSRGKCCSR